MSELKLDLLRQEFPDHLRVGRVYHWPRVEGAKWIETSWHNDMGPSWILKTRSSVQIKLFDYGEYREDREVPSFKRFTVCLYNRHGEYVSHIEEGNTDDIAKVERVLKDLMEVLDA